MAYQQGDTATLGLTVTPHGPDTVAAVTATSPRGVVTTLTAEVGDDTSTWSTQLGLDEPGEWVAEWTVTGTGHSTCRVVLSVAPSAAGPLGRVYATTAQLADYLDDAPPPRARRLQLPAPAGVVTRSAAAVLRP